MKNKLKIRKYIFGWDLSHCRFNVFASFFYFSFNLSINCLCGFLFVCRLLSVWLFSHFCCCFDSIICAALTNICSMWWIIHIQWMLSWFKWDFRINENRNKNNNNNNIYTLFNMHWIINTYTHHLDTLLVSC